MVSFLVLTAWMGIGAASALLVGPRGAIPLAVLFGPFWWAIASEIRPATVPQDEWSERHPVSHRSASQRLRREAT